MTPNASETAGGALATAESRRIALRIAATALYGLLVAACGSQQQTGPPPVPANADNGTVLVPESEYLDGVRPPDDLVLAAEAVEDGYSPLARLVAGTWMLTLVQRPCVFAAAEPHNRYDAESADDCRRINRERFDMRTQQVLRVPPGSYHITVVNQGVPRDVGFWLRPEDEPETTLAAGGGIGADAPATFELELEPGRYLYSCPLNPTPDYLLLVE